MSYRKELTTPEAEIDKGLHSHTEDTNDILALPVGDGYIDDPAKGRVQTVRNVCSTFTSMVVSLTP
jgi:hypothetical protein